MIFFFTFIINVELNYNLFLLGSLECCSGLSLLEHLKLGLRLQVVFLGEPLVTQEFGIHLENKKIRLSIIALLINQKNHPKKYLFALAKT